MITNRALVCNASRGTPWGRVRGLFSAAGKTGFGGLKPPPMLPFFGNKVGQR
jgi:hypothetical protein